MQHNAASIDTTYFCQSMVNFAKMSVLVRFAAPFLVRYSDADHEGIVRPLTDVPPPLLCKDVSYDCDVIGLTMSMIDDATDRPYLRWIDLLTSNYYFEESEMTFWASKETWPIGNPRDATYREFVYDIVDTFRAMTPRGLMKRHDPRNYTRTPRDDEVPDCFFQDPQVISAEQFRSVTSRSLLAQSEEWVGADRDFQEHATLNVEKMRPGQFIYFTNEILCMRLDGSTLFVLVTTPAGGKKYVATLCFRLFDFILDYSEMMRKAKKKLLPMPRKLPVICLSDSDDSDDEPAPKREKKEKE